MTKKLQNTTSKILPLAAILAICVIWHIASVTGMDRPKGMEGKKYATWDLDIPETAKKFLSAVKKDMNILFFTKTSRNDSDFDDFLI